MRQDLILAPMGALVVLTFLVLLQIPIRRFRAAFAGRVGPDDFKYGESDRVPGSVSLANLEVPVLFYLLCLVELVTSTLGTATLVLAWVYVALRIIHSAIHLTYNNVRHRLVAFAASNIVLIAMWIVFFAQYYGGRT